MPCTRPSLQNRKVQQVTCLELGRRQRLVIVWTTSRAGDRPQARADILSCLVRVDEVESQPHLGVASFRRHVLDQVGQLPERHVRPGIDLQLIMHGLLSTLQKCLDAVMLAYLPEDAEQEGAGAGAVERLPRRRQDGLLAAAFPRWLLTGCRSLPCTLSAVSSVLPAVGAIGAGHGGRHGASKVPERPSYIAWTLPVPVPVPVAAAVAVAVAVSVAVAVLLVPLLIALALLTPAFATLLLLLLLLTLAFVGGHGFATEPCLATRRPYDGH
mmetsp:Transcript_43398/g.80843  ORF Transcript_43398/g.80843 Transcript_43398/m.80843 type:complete len:270 (-) Transcript_43398:1-810(-)